jgi:hypothetical protein
MMAATITSGHPVPVPKTPKAASSTAKFPSTSLRVQTHAERMLASPALNDQRRQNEAALARPVDDVPTCDADHPQPEDPHSGTL